jgi:hypothetical protein
LRNAEALRPNRNHLWIRLSTRFDSGEQVKAGFIADQERSLNPSRLSVRDFGRIARDKWPTESLDEGEPLFKCLRKGGRL